MRNLLAKALVILGLLSIISSLLLYWQRVTPRRLSFDNIESVYSSKKNLETTQSQPSALVIRDLSIRLPIYPISVENQNWRTITSGVLYLSESPVPGEVGNSILYGHNWPNLLGNLDKAKPGQEIEIYYSDGSRRKFEIVYTQVVNPSQVEILKPSNDRRLTLYTCSGFLDSKRFVVTALLQETTSTSLLQ